MHGSKRNSDENQLDDAPEDDAPEVGGRGVLARWAISSLFVPLLAACGGKTQAAPPDQFQWDAAADIASDAGARSGGSTSREPIPTTVSSSSSPAPVTTAPVSPVTTVPVSTTTVPPATTDPASSETWDSTFVPDTTAWPETAVTWEEGTTETRAPLTSGPDPWGSSTDVASGVVGDTTFGVPTTDVVSTTEPGETEAISDGNSDATREPPATSAPPSETSAPLDIATLDTATLDTATLAVETTGSLDDTTELAEPTVDGDAGVADASVSGG